MKRSKTATSYRFALLCTLGIIIAGLTTYISAVLGNDFVHWDDSYLIYRNPNIRAITPQTLTAIFTSYDPELYIPLTFVTFQLNYVIDGLNPVVFHATNLALHILNALLAAWFVTLLTSRRWAGAMVACLFLLHPLHTEVVAWAAARKDVLSTAFYLGALISYVYYVGARNQKPETRSQRLYAVSIVCCLLGLLAKVSVITLPVVLLLVDWQQQRQWTRRVLTEKLPYFALSITFGIIAVIGKAKILDNATPWETALMAAKSTVFYIEKLLIPQGFSILHPFTGVITITSPEFYVPLLALALILALLYHNRRNRILIFSAAFFLVTLAPTFTNFAKADDLYVAYDRYAYLSSIGIFLLGSLLIAWLYENMKVNRLLVPALFACACLFLAISGHRLSLTWQNTETLMHNVLRTYPDSYFAYDRLGNVYKDQRRYHESLEAYAASLTHNPTSPRVHSNLGALLGELGYQREELVAYERAVALDPNFVPAHYNAALVYTQQQQFEEAIDHYAQIIIRDVNFLDAKQKLIALLELENGN